MTKYEGGPAFPTGTFEYDGSGNVLTYQEGGMTLRDYFATGAMQGRLASFEGGTLIDKRSVAEFAYKMADAMLVARGLPQT